jgi:hypothetical protein
MSPTLLLWLSEGKMRPDDPARSWVIIVFWLFASIAVLMLAGLLRRVVVSLVQAKPRPPG